MALECMRHMPEPRVTCQRLVSKSQMRNWWLRGHLDGAEQEGAFLIAGGKARDGGAELRARARYVELLNVALDQGRGQLSERASHVFDERGDGALNVG